MSYANSKTLNKKLYFIYFSLDLVVLNKPTNYNGPDIVFQTILLERKKCLWTVHFKGNWCKEICVYIFLF